MRRTKPKKLILMTAFALVLIFSVGTGYSATVSISGPGEVNPAVNSQFTIDILIQDITPLDNLDFWNLGLALSPELNANFVSASGNADPNYVFSGNSFAFDATVQDPYHIVISDSTFDGLGVTDFSDKLLATVVIDISNANFSELYNIDLFGPGTWTLFGDKDFNLADITLDSAYQFHVVPIPGALWLLGSGLVCLIGLRRRTQKH